MEAAGRMKGYALHSPTISHVSIARLTGFCSYTTKERNK
jgi:hypothetical protein